MKTLSTCSDRMKSTVNGPTSASERVRTPPLRMTVWSGRPSLWRTSATGTELVRTVRPGTSVRCLASSKVVVPAEMAIAVPGVTRLAAAAAISVFSLCMSVDLIVNPGSNWELPSTAVAPPWTFSINPSSFRTSRSRRMVMSETPSARTKSATRTAPSSRTRSRIRVWRCRASAGLLALASRSCGVSTTRSNSSWAVPLRRMACLHHPLPMFYSLAIVPPSKPKVNRSNQNPKVPNAKSP